MGGGRQDTNPPMQCGTTLTPIITKNQGCSKFTLFAELVSVQTWSTLPFWELVFRRARSLLHRTVDTPHTPSNHFKALETQVAVWPPHPIMDSSCLPACKNEWNRMSPARVSAFRPARNRYRESVEWDAHSYETKCGASWIFSEITNSSAAPPPPPSPALSFSNKTRQPRLRTKERDQRGGQRGIIPNFFGCGWTEFFRHKDGFGIHYCNETARCFGLRWQRSTHFYRPRHGSCWLGTQRVPHLCFAGTPFFFAATWLCVHIYPFFLASLGSAAEPHWCIKLAGFSSYSFS